MAEYIDTAPHIFEICCIEKCGRDATVCFAAHLKDKQTLYLPSCTDSSHLGKMLAIQLELVEIGTPIKKVKGIDIEEVYTKHRLEPLKCKLLQWEEDHKPKPKVKKRAPGHIPEESDPDAATESWQWVESADLWMSVSGDMVNIKKLKKAEFISAVTTICKLNLSRITKKNAWVKQFLTKDIEFIYPKKEMTVGTKKANEKLEEFYEAAERNEWV